jgi:PPK2 family polyphosphate:nucleotide phosphotransferase
MMKVDIDQFKVKPEKQDKLEDFTTKPPLDEIDDSAIDKKLDQNTEQLIEWQQKLMAEQTRGLIFVLQALDAAGKDEAERYLFSRLSTQALHTTSIDQPSEEEKNHDYLWRLHEAMPERGVIAVFNRSHYEDLIAARVYDSISDNPLPDEIKNDPEIWQKRFKHVDNFEDYLEDNGFHMIKIFLHVSKDIQKERLLERMENPDKHWEFSFSDLTDRKHWAEQMEVFEDTFQHTSTASAPWYVVPADHGAYGRLVISEILLDKLEELNPKYPEISDEEKEKIKEAAKDLRAGKYD